VVQASTGFGGNAPVKGLQCVGRYTSVVTVILCTCELPALGFYVATVRMTYDELRSGGNVGCESELHRSITAGTIKH
jgi:hypothetical protein